MKILSDFRGMFIALYHGWVEGAVAAGMSEDGASRRQLRADFFFSRLLRLMHWSSYNKKRHVKICGISACYRFNRGDLQSLREILIEEVYCCDLLAAPQTVLDLGANIGLTSVWLAHRFPYGRSLSTPAKACMFVALEPLRANAEVAAINFQLSGVRGEVICAAVGQRSGEAWFEARDESNLGRVLKTCEGQGDAYVPVVGIRELLGRFPKGKVDLVKMDIEGGEEDLLAHDIDWLASVGSLMVEWHDNRVDSAPLIANVISAGFTHQRINVRRQDNLSLFTRS